LTARESASLASTFFLLMGPRPMVAAVLTRENHVRPTRPTPPWTPFASTASSRPRGLSRARPVGPAASRSSTPPGVALSSAAGLHPAHPSRAPSAASLTVDALSLAVAAAWGRLVDHLRSALGEDGVAATWLAAAPVARICTAATRRAPARDLAVGSHGGCPAEYVAKEWMGEQEAPLWRGRTPAWV